MLAIDKVIAGLVQYIIYLIHVTVHLLPFLVSYHVSNILLNVQTYGFLTFIPQNNMKPFIVIHQKKPCCFPDYSIEICYAFIHAAILQFPAIHKKKPPRSGYRRTKINRKSFHLLQNSQ